MRQRLINWMLAVLVVCGVTLGVGPGAVTISPAEAAPQIEMARVRFVNAGVDVPALNVYANGTLWAGGVADAVGYLDIPAGDYTFTFKLVGRAEPLASVLASFKSGDRMTIAAVNTLANLEAIAFADDVSAPARNSARVKVVHAVPDVAQLSVTLDGISLSGPLTFGSVSEAVQARAGTHAVAVLSADGEPLLAASEQPFDAERVYTIFVTGPAESPRLLVTGSTVLRPAADTSIRFAHMIAGVGPVALYVNGEPVPLFGSVSFSSVTASVASGPGDYVFELYPVGLGPGDTDPLVEYNADLNRAVNVILVAYGTLDTPEMMGYEIAHGPIMPDSVWFQVIHAASGNPALQVKTLDGIELSDRIAVGGQDVRSMAAGTYSLRLTDADDASAVQMEKRGIVLLPGTTALTIVFDDDARLPLVNAVVVALDMSAEYAAVRWAHAYSLADSAVDVYLNGAMLLEDVNYGDVIGHTLLSPQSYALTVFPAGADPNVALPLISRTLDLSITDAPRTVLLFGAPGEPLVRTVPDSIALMSPDRARIRFVNVAEGVPVIEVRNAATDEFLVQGVGYGAGSVHINIPAGAHRWRITSNGAPLLTLPEKDYEPGVVYTVLLTGNRTPAVADDAAGEDAAEVAPLEAHIAQYTP